VTIKNTGTEPDRLVSGSTPVAGKFEYPSNEHGQGSHEDAPGPGRRGIKPGETVELKPQSFHIMMMGLKQPIEKGKPFKGSLVFREGGYGRRRFRRRGGGGDARRPRPRTTCMTCKTCYIELLRLGEIRLSCLPAAPR